MAKLIELWKTECEHCEALAPRLAELEKDGLTVERHNIETPEGEKVMREWLPEIIRHNISQGVNPNFIYTPTLINPETREVLSAPDFTPTREQVVALAGSK